MRQPLCKGRRVSHRFCRCLHRLSVAFGVTSHVKGAACRRKGCTVSQGEGHSEQISLCVSVKALQTASALQIKQLRNCLNRWFP